MIPKATCLALIVVLVFGQNGTAQVSPWLEGEGEYEGKATRYVLSHQWFGSCFYSTFDLSIHCGVRIEPDRIAFNLKLTEKDLFEASLRVTRNVPGSEWRARTDDVDAITYRVTNASASDSQRLFDSILNGSSFYTTFVHIDDGYVEHHASAEGFTEAVEWIRQRLIEFEDEHPHAEDVAP